MKKKGYPSPSDPLLADQLARAIGDSQGRYDVAQRHVYADMLCERDDPRGEFINLQLLANPSALQVDRATFLLRKHRIDWLGSLAEFIEIDDGPEEVWTGAYYHEGGAIRLAFKDALCRRSIQSVCA